MVAQITEYDEDTNWNQEDENKENRLNRAIKEAKTSLKKLDNNTIAEKILHYFDVIRIADFLQIKEIFLNGNKLH